MSSASSSSGSSTATASIVTKSPPTAGGDAQKLSGEALAAAVLAASSASMVTRSPTPTGGNAEKLPGASTVALAAVAEGSPASSASSWDIRVTGFMSSAPAMLALLSSRNATIHATKACLTLCGPRTGAGAG
jgi:hypothetical protein